MEVIMKYFLIEKSERYYEWLPKLTDVTILSKKLLNQENILIINNTMKSDKIKALIQEGNGSCCIAVHQSNTLNFDWLKNFNSGTHSPPRLYQYSIGRNEIGVFDGNLEQTMVDDGDDNQIGIRDIHLKLFLKLYSKIPDLFLKVDKTVKKNRETLNLVDLNLYISTLKLLLKARQNIDSVSQNISDSLGTLVDKLNTNLSNIPDLEEKIEELKKNIEQINNAPEIIQNIDNIINNSNKLIEKLNEIKKQTEQEDK